MPAPDTLCWPRSKSAASGGSSRSSWRSCYHTQCCSTLCWRLLFPGTVGSRACPLLESDGSILVLCSSSSALSSVLSCVGCTAPNCCGDPGCERCLLLLTPWGVPSFQSWDEQCVQILPLAELPSLMWQQSSLLQAKSEFLEAGM